MKRAHPEVVQILLQVLEDGRLTDSLGRIVDFRNTIIIMTSNVGAEVLQKDVTLGFGSGLSEESDFQSLKNKVLDEAKKAFKPEFLNRINEIVVFRNLSKDHMLEIVDLELAKVFKRLEHMEIDLGVEQEVKEYLIEKGYDKKFGARPLSRAIERHLEDPLAEALLKGEIKKGAPLSAVIRDEKVAFEQSEASVK